MRLTPIPRLVLSESVKVRVPVPDDYGLAWSEEAQELNHVRIETSQALVNKGFVLTDGCTAVMYVDAINSQGLKEIPVGSLVLVGEDWRSVISVTPCEVGSRVHHWEVELR